MHNNTDSNDISQFSTHLGWRPLCKYLFLVKKEGDLPHNFPLFTRCHSRITHSRFLPIAVIHRASTLRIQLLLQHSLTETRTMYYTLYWT